MSTDRKRKLKWIDRGPYSGPLLTTKHGQCLATVSERSGIYPPAPVVVLFIDPKTSRPWSKKRAREFLDKTYC